MNHQEILYKIRITSLLLLLFFSQYSLAAQIYDSLMYESSNMIIIKNLKTNKFQITNRLTKAVLNEVKFVKRINHYFQVLSKEKEIFYIHKNWRIKKEVKDYIGICGTVPHYTLTVQQNENSFAVFENETFYDHNDALPPQKLFEISKSEADSILLINGKSKFSFTSIFGFGIDITDPKTILLIKDGKYFVKGNPKEWYDNLDFSNYSYSIKTFKNGLYGILNLTKPKYLEISAFQYYLAKAMLPDGREIYIDINGKEYY